MPGGERGFGAEHRPHLENAVDATRHGHLLVELRRLRQEGVTAEVLQLEHLGAGLGRRTHQLRRVHLGAAVVESELAPRLFEGGLDREQQLGRRTQADVQEPPVEPTLQVGVLVDRQRRVRLVQDLDRLRDEFQAAEVDHGIVHHPADDPDRGLDGEPFDHRFQLVAGALPRVRHLHHAGAVPDQDELHLPLQPQGVHPARDRDRAPYVIAQVANQHAHEGPPIRSMPRRAQPPDRIMSQLAADVAAHVNGSVPPITSGTLVARLRMDRQVGNSYPARCPGCHAGRSRCYDSRVGVGTALNSRFTACRFPVRVRRPLAVAADTVNPTRARDRIAVALDDLYGYFGLRGLAAVAVAGTPDDCVKGVRDVMDAGAEMILFNPMFDDAEQMERIAAQVIPRLG